ncbi:FG-GAP-like repeat-containing protein [Stieleria varia]|uniref:ASPIC and UnbV n=1 Tax=Stieleria varia TaxID=2528005 RepID=A0A5C6AX13_9BACT|nr:FG-GAP-like repeat-containing protein [Stieleria varia]TWU04280.1 ASPIC and UnbV [Stieleria varia]
MAAYRIAAYRIIGYAMVFVLLSGCGSPTTTESESQSGGADSHAVSASVFSPTAVQLAISRGDIATADAAIKARLVQEPTDSTALEMAGDVAVLTGDLSQAAVMYRESLANVAAPSQAILSKLSQVLMHQSLPFDALEVLERMIELYPDVVQPRYDLVGMAAMIGLPDRCIASLRWLLQNGHGDPESLVVLANTGRVEPDAELCRKLLSERPSDLRPEYGIALIDAIYLRWDKVATRLEPVVAKHPQFVPALGLYGRALIKLNRLDELATWQQSLPDSMEQSADYWIVMGLWSQKMGQHEQAARALWESFRIDETTHSEMLKSLLLSLKQIGRDAEAERVAKQIVKMSALRDSLHVFLERNSQSQAAAMKVAEAMAALGRLWEAEGWARLAVGLSDDPVIDSRERYLAIRRQLTVTTPWQSPEMSIANSIDLSDLPDIKPPSSHGPLRIAQPGSDSPKHSSDASIHFVEEAAQRGLEHTCAVAAEAETEGHWIYQSVGGGLGVIDFDLDGWPDLAGAMLDGKPRQSNSSPNRLFRNHQGRFDEVSRFAEYQDLGFTHGICIGDYNDDGFPDIFDGNIGQDRLYRNNGDGTFQDVTEQVGLSGQAWTTSSAMADLNGDGFADLFAAAYCGGDQPYEIACSNNQGIATCPPLQFDAARDTIWRGVGDGTFVDASEEWMQPTSLGRGLGVVVGEFDEHPGVDVYVANDMTANHLWSGKSDTAGFQLNDLAAIRGIGTDANSNAQASMGIAVGDPDGDGDIDFFLTHFSNEHNTYYEQVAPGLWSDKSFQVGLLQPSMNMLGFGTQWADFDNNSALELILTNGHVDDVDREDIAYRMPTQVFRRNPDGRWSELDRPELGEYFTRDHLGRALVTLDADRDGRIDVSISNLYEPVALLVNRSENHGHHIALELKATRSQRDAIGTTVRMKIDGRTVLSQLFSGDGYMSSNERQIWIGTGGETAVQDVTVIWPSGVEQKLGAMVSGKRYLIVEDQEQAFEFPTSDGEAGS